MLSTTIGSSDYLHVLTLNVYPKEIDWAVISDDIKGSGLCYFRQAIALGKEWSTLQKWRNGAQPRFCDGHALLMLHTKICGEELTKKRLGDSRMKY